MLLYKAFDPILNLPIIYANYFLLPFKSNEKIAIFPLLKKQK